MIRTRACTASPANLSEIIYSLAYGVSASFARQSAKKVKCVAVFATQKGSPHSLGKTGHLAAVVHIIC